MPRFFVDIACNYHFPKVVVYVSKGKCFLGVFFSAANKAFINLWIFPINYKRRVKRSCFELGNGNEKQQGQLGRTTFRGVRANSPARRRNADRKGGVSVLVRGLYINHGPSRTVLADARTLLERGERIYVRLELGRSWFTVVQVVVKT